MFIGSYSRDLVSFGYGHNSGKYYGTFSEIISIQNNTPENANHINIHVHWVDVLV